MFLLTTLSSAQIIKYERREGTVSYVSIQHIYVKFENTDSIHIGDTLFIPNAGSEIPAVKVKFISSKSCAGENISRLVLKPEDKLIVHLRITEQKTQTTISAADTVGKSTSEQKINRPKLQKKYSRKNTWGKFSVQSLSSYSNIENSSDQRWRYSSSFNADSIGGSGFSFSSYLFFAYNNKDWTEVKNHIGTALKIYDFSIG